MIKKILHYLRDYARGLYPFLACVVGGFFFIALALETSMVVRLVCVSFGCCCYAWAIDMAEARAKAAAEGRAARLILDTLTSGRSSEIRVAITEKRQAD